MGSFFEVEALDDHVLAERASDHVSPQRFELFDLLVAKKADLPMPFPCMGIVLYPPIGKQLDEWGLRLLYAFDVAGANGFGRAHVAPSFA